MGNGSQVESKQNKEETEQLSRFTEKEMRVLRQLFDKIRNYGQESKQVHEIQHKNPDKNLFIEHKSFCEFFKRGFLSEELVSLIFKRWIKYGPSKEMQKGVSFLQMVEGLSDCLKTQNSGSFVNFYVSLFVEDTSNYAKVSRDQVFDMLIQAAELHFKLYRKMDKKEKEEEVNEVPNISEEEKKYLSSVVEYLYSEVEDVNISTLCGWVSRRTPNLAFQLPYVLFTHCFYSEESFEELRSEDVLCTDILNRVQEFVLSLKMPTPSYVANYHNNFEIEFVHVESNPTVDLPSPTENTELDSEEEEIKQAALNKVSHRIDKFSYKNWTLLFSTNKHGKSVNRFEHNVFSYDHPTMLLLKTTDGNVFGAYCVSEWKIHNNFYGGKLFFFVDNLFCMCFSL